MYAPKKLAHSIGKKTRQPIIRDFISKKNITPETNAIGPWIESVEMAIDIPATVRASSVMRVCPEIRFEEPTINIATQEIPMYPDKKFMFPKVPKVA
jgi:hypothetical protein